MRHRANSKFLLFHHAKRFISNDSPPKLKPFDTIPGPRPLPLVGNIWRSRYGPIVREQLTRNHTILHLFDPDDIESFFRQDGKYPHRRSHRALLKYRHDRPDLYRDGGLFPENGLNWYRQRNQFQQYLMSKSGVSANARKIDEVSLRTVERIQANFDDNNPITINNFEALLYRWALENSLYLFLDCRADNLDAKFIEEYIQQLHNTLLALEKTEIQTEKWIKHPDKCPHFKLLADAQEFLYDFVSTQIDRSAGTSPKDSFIWNWLNVDRLDRRDVVSFVIDSLMAGLHTTSYITAWFLYRLSENNDIYRSLYREISQGLPSDGYLTTENIDKLTLLRDCLKETMRLNPVSIGTGRVSQNNLTIRNFEIPKGAMIIAQTQAISRDESIYAESDKFKPERWAHYRTCPRHKRPSPFASLPFGFGSRACIGQRLAELQIKILVVRLLQKFDIHVKRFCIKTVLVHTIDRHIEAEIKKVS